MPLGSTKRSIEDYGQAYAAKLREYSGRTRPPKIVAEGDSWFRGLTQLVPKIRYRLDNVPILNLADKGDTISEISSDFPADAQSMASPRQLGILMDVVEEFRFEALLLSGGGNDLVLTGRKYIVKDFHSDEEPCQILIEDALDAILDGVMAGYEKVIDVARTASPGIKVFVHQYDYPTAFERKSKFLFFRFGPWFKKVLDAQCIEANCRPETAEAVVHEVIRKLAGRIADLSTGDALCHLVGTLGTLEKDDWTDEMHPNNASGGGKIADLFAASIRKQFPDRIL